MHISAHNNETEGWLIFFTILTIMPAIVAGASWHFARRYPTKSMWMIAMRVLLICTLIFVALMSFCMLTALTWRVLERP